MMAYLKNITVFEIESALTNEDNLIQAFLTQKFFWKSFGSEVTDTYDQQIPKFASNHSYLAVISLISALYKDGNYYQQVFLKEYE